MQFGEEATFAGLNTQLAVMQRYRETLDPHSEQQFKQQFQAQILPITMDSDFCRYFYDKPRGYAGDFLAMEKIWLGRSQSDRYRYLGKNRLGQLVNAYTLDMSNCAANEYRVYYLKNRILSKPYKRIASIGCGSAIEIELAAKEVSLGAEVHLFDQDNGALETAAAKLRNLGCTPILYPGNIVRTLYKLDADKFDLIYSSGMFDYFQDASAKKLIQKIWDLVLPDGTLIVTNANGLNPTKFWMEYVTEWYLEYKNTPGMLALAGFSEEIRSIQFEKDPYGVYQYLNLTK